MLYLHLQGMVMNALKGGPEGWLDAGEAGLREPAAIVPVRSEKKQMLQAF